MVESVKAASDVFAPVAGEVVEVNGDLAGQPALVNEDAEGKAWFFKIKVANPAELDALMDRAAYEAFVKESPDAGEWRMAHEYKATVSWKRDDGERSPTASYSRAHQWSLRRRRRGAGFLVAAVGAAAVSRAPMPSIPRKRSSPRCRAATC